MCRGGGGKDTLPFQSLVVVGFIRPVVVEKRGGGGKEEMWGKLKIQYTTNE